MMVDHSFLGLRGRFKEFSAAFFFFPGRLLFPVPADPSSGGPAVGGSIAGRSRRVIGLLPPSRPDTAAYPAGRAVQRHPEQLGPHRGPRLDRRTQRWRPGFAESEDVVFSLSLTHHLGNLLGFFYTFIMNPWPANPRRRRRKR